MTKFTGQLGQMKVKSSQLKAKLPHYLRYVRESGEKVQILLREEPVAYLCGIEQEPLTPEDLEELNVLKRRFAAAGLVLGVPDVRSVPLPKLSPRRAGDDNTDLSTVEAMRAERDW